MTISGVGSFLTTTPFPTHALSIDNFTSCRMTVQGWLTSSGVRINASCLSEFGFWRVNRFFRLTPPISLTRCFHPTTKFLLPTRHVPRRMLRVHCHITTAGTVITNPSQRRVRLLSPWVFGRWMIYLDWFNGKNRLYLWWRFDWKETSSLFRIFYQSSPIWGSSLIKYEGRT